MVHTGEWLFPRIGGDLYPDKPPVYFWLLSICYWLTGSLKASFLIPAFVSSLVVVGLVYDLGRRLAGRASGLAAGLTLASTIQFVMTMRGAQIDPVLCALTTLSLYGLLRHLLRGACVGLVFRRRCGCWCWRRYQGRWVSAVVGADSVCGFEGGGVLFSARPSPEAFEWEASIAGRLGCGALVARWQRVLVPVGGASGAVATVAPAASAAVGGGGWRWGLVAVGFAGCIDLAGNRCSTYRSPPAAIPPDRLSKRNPLPSNLRCKTVAHRRLAPASSPEYFFIV